MHNIGNGSKRRHSADGYGQKASTKQSSFYVLFPLTAASDEQYNPDGVVDIKVQLTMNISGAHSTQYC